LIFPKKILECSGHSKIRSLFATCPLDATFKKSFWKYCSYDEGFVMKIEHFLLLQKKPGRLHTFVLSYLGAHSFTGKYTEI